MAAPVLAVAIEPGRLAAGLVGADGAVMVRDRVTMPSRDVWRSLERLVRRVNAAAPHGLVPFNAVGVSCVGPVDERAGTVSPPHVPGWASFPLRDHLEDLTQQPVTLSSAGSAAAEAERRLGEARDTASYLFVVADATVDSACVIDGRRVQGAHGNAGGIAHITVSPDDGSLRCWCGATGCLEPYLASIALEAEMNRPLRRANPSMIERGGIMLGRAVASMCASLDVSTVFVTGGVIDAFGDQLLDTARRELHTRSRLATLADLRLVEPVEHLGPLARAAAMVDAAGLIDGVARSATAR
ncbi:MAG: ROK family protein [Ilumatobacter sp.]